MGEGGHSDFRHDATFISRNCTLDIVKQQYDELPGTWPSCASVIDVH